MLLSGSLLWLGSVILTVFALLRPTRLTPARAMARLGRMCPSDIGLRFEDCDFDVRDDRPEATIKLLGWFVPTPTRSSRTVVIIHGYGDGRAGALAWAPVWIEIGINVLLFDLRAHGESGGEFTTAGLFEQRDVEQVIQELRARKAFETSEIFLFGISMGASIALAAAEQTSGIAGVVLESPVADFTHGAITQSQLMGLPGPTIVRPGVRLAELWFGKSYADIRPASIIKRFNTPVLAFIPSADAFLPAGDAKELRDAISARQIIDQVSQVIDIPEATHLLCLQIDPIQYMQALNRFCNACTSGGLARASAEGAAAGQID